MKAYKSDIQAGITREFRPKPAWISVGYWVWINLLTLLLRRGRESSSLELRYEDFVSQPTNAMRQIGKWSGLDFETTTSTMLAGEPLQPEHTIAGNRVRMSGKVTLKPDWEWTTKLPRQDRAIGWLMAGWLLKRFGYQRASDGAIHAEIPDQRQ
jgi:hypothetical protein